MDWMRKAAAIRCHLSVGVKEPFVAGERFDSSSLGRTRANCARFSSLEFSKLLAACSIGKPGVRSPFFRVWHFAPFDL